MRQTFTFMEKLLEGVEVEWKPLGEVADIVNGYVFPLKYQGNTKVDIPFYKVSDMNTHGNEIFMCISNNYLNIYQIKELKAKIYPKGTIIFPKIGAAIATNKKRIITKGSIIDNNIAGLIAKYCVNYKYLFYYFQKINLIDLAKGIGSVPSISKQTLSTVPIPIPPLHVQKEIVRILDKFTALTTELKTELKTELTARKKQYNHYRDQLLNFNDRDVEWKPLGDIGELIRGNGLQKKDFTESGVPAIHYGQIYTYYGLSTYTTKSFVPINVAKKLKKVNQGDVIITNTSENLDDVGKSLFYYGDETAVTGGHATIFKPNPVILGKFFVFLTCTKYFQTQKRKYAKGTKVIDISSSDLAKIIIPIPPLHVQKEIISILDKFDALTHSMSEGLPREIELRQKQYEYYRDLLLSFPQPDEKATKS